MKKYIACFLTLLIFPILLSGQQRDWLKRSDLVFQGEVLKLFTSTVDLADPSEVGLVRVTDIIEGSSVLQDYLQKPITVRFRDIKDVKPGQKAIFYARLWISGRGIAVEEVGMKRLDAGDTSGLRQKEEIRKERTKLQEDSLRELIKGADQVLTGRVVSLKRLAVTTTKESEHDPMWTEAEIEVEEGLKGDLRRGSRVKITFAASTDIMWVRSPKFVRGQSGVWILRKNVDVFDRPPNYVIIDRAQFLNMKQRDDVRRLVQ